MQEQSLVPQPSVLRLPVAQIRHVFSPAEVERKLARLQEAGNQRDYDNLRSVYERMLERGPERFQVKPRACPTWPGCTRRCPTSAPCSTT